MASLEETYPHLEALSDALKIHMLCVAMTRAAELWELSAGEAARLAGFSGEQWLKIREGKEPAELTREQMVRASCIIGIFRCLRIIFNGPLAYGWMTHSNKGPLFNGNRPIDVINAGGPENLVKVREHLLHLGGGCLASGTEDEFEPISAEVTW